MKKYIVAATVLSFLMTVPAVQAAALPPDLATSWSQLLAVMQVKLSGMSGQIATDQQTINVTVGQLAALRTQLSLLSSTTDPVTRDQILANAQAVVSGATVQVSAISQRWEAFSKVLSSMVSPLRDILAGIRDLMAQ